MIAQSLRPHVVQVARTALAHADDAAVPVEQHGPRAGSATIDSDDQGHARAVYAITPRGGAVAAAGPGPQAAIEGSASLA